MLQAPITSWIVRSCLAGVPGGSRNPLDFGRIRSGALGTEVVVVANLDASLHGFTPPIPNDAINMALAQRYHDQGTAISFSSSSQATSAQNGHHSSTVATTATYIYSFPLSLRHYLTRP